MRITPHRFLSVLLLSSGCAFAAPVFQTGFETTDGYSTGALSGGAWAISNAGANTQWIVQQDSANPSAPASLPGNKHPLSPSGGQMLWLSPQTTNVSANQVAVLTFASAAAKLQEPFKLSMDLFASPTGGNGQSFTVHLARDDSASATTAPRFSFTSTNTSSLSLNVWDGGSATSGVASLPKDSWLRLEFSVNASTSSSNGTYTFSVYQLDAAGSITSTLYSSDPLAYTLSAGFNSLRFLTNSSRTDYWIDNISVSTIPEPGTAAALIGVSALTIGAGYRPRR